MPNGDIESANTRNCSLGQFHQKISPVAPGMTECLASSTGSTTPSPRGGAARSADQVAAVRDVELGEGDKHELVELVVEAF